MTSWSKNPDKSQAMNVDVRIDAEQGVAFIHITGKADVAQALAGGLDFLSHPEFRPGMASVFDLREARFAHLSADAMRSVGEQNRRVAEERGQARVALVVSDDLHFGLARMYEAVAESPNLEVRAFRDPDAALDWVLHRADANI